MQNKDFEKRTLKQVGDYEEIKEFDLYGDGNWFMICPHCGNQAREDRASYMLDNLEFCKKCHRVIGHAMRPITSRPGWDE